MAKPKRSQPKPRREPTFYESLPIAVMPPAAWPELSEHLSTGAGIFGESGRRLARWFKGGHWRRIVHIGRIRQRPLWPALQRFGGRVTGWLLMISFCATEQLTYSRRRLRYAATYGTQAAFGYTPPLAADVRTAARRSRRAALSRPARRIYLLLVVTGLATAGTIGTMVALKTIKTYAYDISSPAALMAVKKTGTVILDRNGKVLFEGYGAQAAQPVALSDIPSSLKNATVAAEDPTFYTNPGFSVKGLARAAVIDVTHTSTMEGGSTITQQLVKNALLNSNKTLQRKYQELLLSIELAHRYTKGQILDMYLNAIYYGQGSTGVQVAAQTYFHKPVSQLTLGESALLAGLPLGPSRFDPNFDTGAATGRRNYVLGRMADLHMITGAQAAAAEAQPMQLAATGAPVTAQAGSQPMLVYSKTVNIQAPWFVFYVLDQLRAEYGDDMVEQGGITVKTTLDLDKEQAAEKIIQNQINNLASHNVTDGALVSLDPKTGDILSMVGSVNYDAAGFGNVNATLSQLQPGSSFKPIAYATAFEKGWTGATQVLDAPVTFTGAGGSVYTPQNYDLKFHGVVTLRHALDNSLNIPAVKVLQFATIPATLVTAHAMGITTLNDSSQYGLSLVLGGGDVTPLDMATVYETLDNNGVKIEPRAILKVTNRDGKDITKDTQAAPQQVLDPRIAYMLTNIMQDNSARLPEFPLNGPLELSNGRPAAAKTGTTNDFDDNWTIGYTPQIVTAVWVGNANHTPMQNVDGITGAAPIWHQYMEMALNGQPIENFTQPAGISMLTVCQDGGLSAPGSPGSYQEAFMTSNLPTRQCGTSDLSDGSTLPTAAPAAPPTPPPGLPLASPPPIDQARPGHDNHGGHNHF